jgi:RimJ/RimL family protein N-acetyltransferase
MSSNQQVQPETSKTSNQLLPSMVQIGDVVLRDGSLVHVREMQREDEPILFSLFRSLAEDSRWMRFFCVPKDSGLAVEAHREAQVDHCRTFGLIAFAGQEERIVGHAFYAATGADHAEVAFTIAEDYRGRGLASILLSQLAEVALANGINVFEAEVLINNQPMLGVFRNSGFPITFKADAGQVHVTFPISVSDRALSNSSAASPYAH